LKGVFASLDSAEVVLSKNVLLKGVVAAGCLREGVIAQRARVASDESACGPDIMVIGLILRLISGSNCVVCRGIISASLVIR